MDTHLIKTTLTEDGKLTLDNLPFRQGDRVEIIILERSSFKTTTDSYPLTGTVIRYDDPFEPIAIPED